MFYTKLPGLSYTISNEIYSSKVIAVNTGIFFQRLFTPKCLLSFNMNGLFLSFCCRELKISRPFSEPFRCKGRRILKSFPEPFFCKDERTLKVR